jgi:hypothetical protein
LALDNPRDFRITAIERAPGTGDMLRIDLCTECSSHFVGNLAGAGDLRVEVDVKVRVSDVLTKFRGASWNG